ncbi:NUDIX hydrolase [Zavarzinia compransoris]|uniref:DNA mismatch repair protein MutT n=1 Tax=Zavarzinia compransoris TaxID=1264899 RepID=A0A317E122_9PROT|nr:NUDIX hydrolase [Zavarzinia compransoris]PWR19820.1 DNA mismatch repair protein MutT [Zavarzinia compransoris]TDP45075.1 8-oxo-dGTP pyrophosphatase MutT (NUDIX family) [Zavarzinia compransoris]
MTTRAEPAGRRVRAKPAASLILIGPEGSVLMGRRPSRSRFAPDAWVFPGGRVDAADLRAGGDRFRAAAVRETAEETGLAVDPARLAPLGRAITPSESPIRFDARFFITRADPACRAAPLVTNGEFTDLLWLPLGEARRLPLMDVTELMLDEAIARDRGGPDGVLTLTYRRGRALIVRR